MYKLVLPIAAYQNGESVIIPSGLARDLFAQHSVEPNLRVICPCAPDTREIADPLEIDLKKHPGLGFCLLPWNGWRKTWFTKWPKVKKVLQEEAATADVWHTTCSREIWDLTTMAYAVGRKQAKKLRVLCLDSDPSEMIRMSGGLKNSIKANFVQRNLQKRAAEADAVIFVGRGVQAKYGKFPKKSILTEAVWLVEGEVADELSTAQKFADPNETVRMIVATRFTAWKGVDDAIDAAEKLLSSNPGFILDVMGEGAEKPNLMDRPATRRLQQAGKVRFLDPVPYGEPFFKTLRSYHLSLIPTRGLEEARIAYDSAASGCVLVHSDTPTLRGALEEIQPRWMHPPGDVAALASAISDAIQGRSVWEQAAQSGIRFMRGRQIETMHRKRADFLRKIAGGVG